MNFLTQIYDFMFAPAGTFDSDSGSEDTSSDNYFVEHESTIVNPANSTPMPDSGLMCARSSLTAGIGFGDSSPNGELWPARWN